MRMGYFFSKINPAAVGVYALYELVGNGHESGKNLM
jgi:hypothetical protein